MVEFSDLNPFKNVDLGTWGFIFLVFFIAVLIFCLIGLLIFVIIRKKKYKHKIPLLKTVGSGVLHIADYKARDYPIGRAGDKLWFVKGAKKFIPPASLQSGQNEFTHFERSDGEWININYPAIDEQMQKIGVKYVKQDMRSNRVAINTLLDQRFTEKSWWDKYGNMLMNVIFYFVVAVAMVIIFYQWGDIVTRTSQLLDKIVQLENQRVANSPQGVVPALLLFWRLKFKK